jgi:hypothetical protein
VEANVNPTVIETIRGFRGAIAAGTIWLLATWIAFHKHIDPQVSHSATASVLGRLAHLLGQTGSLIALLILAAAAGSVSQQIFRAPAMWIGLMSTWVVRTTEAGISEMIGFIRGRRVLRRFEDWEPYAVDLARRMVDHDETMRGDSGVTLSSEQARRAYRAYDRRIRQELLDPSRHSSLIHVLDEQANLRFGLVIPLLALIVALAAHLSGWFWILAPVPFIISFQGGEFRGLCNELLESASREAGPA